MSVLGTLLPGGLPDFPFCASPFGLLSRAPSPRILEVFPAALAGGALQAETVCPHGGVGRWWMLVVGVDE